MLHIFVTYFMNVFITGYAEYISEGYDVAALHYLIKPIDKKKLFSILDKAIAKKKQNEVFLTDSTVLPLPRVAYEPLNRAIITAT